MNRDDKNEQTKGISLPKTFTSDLRGRQSVRATFKLSEGCIEAISIVAAHLGIKQKSLFDHLVEDASIEVEDFEKKIMNEMIDLFVKVVMEEFDAKRSTSDYVLTDKFKDFRQEITKIKIFPKELVERLDKVIEGDPVEKIAYDIEKIESKYKKI